jgi:hypothetical protein
MREIDALGQFLSIHHDEAALEMRFLLPEEGCGPGSEDPLVQTVRDRIVSANRGVLYPGGVLSGLGIGE